MSMSRKALPSILIISFVLLFMPKPALAIDYGVGNAGELSIALGKIADGDTIRLTADIDFSGYIAVSGKSVTFDLNGHTLNVTNSAGNGLDVGSGGVVNVTGSGALNAASSAADGYGVNAHNGGRATVTNASATGTNGIGAHAINAGSFVHVTGSAISSDNIGALARNEGSVTVGGNAEGVTGADATGNNTFIDIAGNVTGQKGVSCALEGVVRVGGNVIATGNCADPRAIAIAYRGTVEVSGSVTGSGVGTVGAWIYDNGTITVDGTLNAPIFVELQDVASVAASGVPGTAPYESYLVYTDGINTVRVGRLLSAVIDSGASFDKNPANSADISLSVTWNNASSISDIKAGGASIGAGSYSISGNTLTIKKEYLASQAAGNLALSVEYDAGDASALTIAIGDSTPPPVTGLPDSHTLYMGGRTTLNPLPEGGVWNWDQEYLSADIGVSGSPATFTALKPGTTVITYSANGISHSITVTVRKTSLPQTGQSSTIFGILCSFAALFFITAVMLVSKAGKGRI